MTGDRIMVSFHDYSFAYGDEGQEQAVHGIDLSIGRGQCILLCGASGCGKSTLLKSVNGLIPHLTTGKRKGEVFVSGCAVSSIPMYELAKLTSSVFQNPKSQFFNTDVESEIVFTLENRGMPVSEIDERLNDTIKKLRLDSLKDRSMFALSGGEKQQVAFAGAFISGAPVIILDEPTANLDAGAIGRVRDIILRMKADGRTILIAEHRLSWLRDIVDHVCYMENGIITKQWNGKDFFSISETERKQLGLRELTPSLKSDMAGKSEDIQSVPALEAKDLTLGYKKTIIQSGLSFSLKPGEILGITGVNGAGKTTLLRALAGLEKAGKGRILLNGKPVGRHERRKHFGMVMQDVNYQLFSDSCENECILGNPNVKGKDAFRLLSEVGLGSLADRHPQSLSGGQKQRLALAVCKASNKDILLLDEPTSGLDYASILAVRNVLRDLANEGKSVIIVTHDYEFAQMVCERLLHLQTRSNPL